MKLNIYSLSFFLIIFIILYPLTFYISEKKIAQKNKSEIVYYYDVWGYLSIKSMEKIFLNSKEELKEINKKYFDNINVFTIKPEEKFTGGFKNIVEDNEYFFDANRPSQSYLDKNNDLILALNNKIIFYFDLLNIHNFFKEEIARLKYNKKNFANECGNISQNLVFLRVIDYSTFQFRLSVDQKMTSIEELEDNEKIFKLFINCFENKVNILFQLFILHLDDYFILNNEGMKNSVNSFISNNSNLFSDQENIEKFKNDIFKIYNNLRNSFRKINKDVVELKYLKSEIEINDNFQKKNNIYALSFILNFMVALIIFYLFFFLRKQFTFLNKIF